MVYEETAGGSGLAVEGYRSLADLLQMALSTVRECVCRRASGCPACVQSGACHSNAVPIHKMAASVILEGLLALSHAA